MMIYDHQNINASTTTTLTAPGVGSGNFDLSIVNRMTTAIEISIWLYADETQNSIYYIERALIVPGRTSLEVMTKHDVGELTEGLGLRIQTHTATANPQITIHKISR